MRFRRTFRSVFLANIHMKYHSDTPTNTDLTGPVKIVSMVTFKISGGPSCDEQEELRVVFHERVVVGYEEQTMPPRSQIKGPGDQNVD